MSAFRWCYVGWGLSRWFDGFLVLVSYPMLLNVDMWILICGIVQLFHWLYLCIEAIKLHRQAPDWPPDIDTYIQSVEQLNYNHIIASTYLHSMASGITPGCGNPKIAWTSPSLYNTIAWVSHNPSFLEWPRGATLTSRWKRVFEAK